MSPELCAPPPERSSFASDIWAYGCIILEVTSAREPWIEQYPDDSLLFRALQRHENASSFARICANQRGPTHLHQLLMKCCSWSKSDRPNFTDILQKLGGYDSLLPLSIENNNDVTMDEFASCSSSPSPPPPPVLEKTFSRSKNHGGRLTGEVYTSKGSASGRVIYEGVKGGRYYLTESGKKVYLQK